eukprot:EG_transcript_1963
MTSSGFICPSTGVVDLFRWRTICDSYPLPAERCWPTHDLLAAAGATAAGDVPPFPSSVSLERFEEQSNHLSSENSSDAEEHPSPDRLRRPNGRYPCCDMGRCGHKGHWQRLRGKRGFSYFHCKFCGLSWRQPTKPSTAEAPFEEVLVAYLPAVMPIHH